MNAALFMMAFMAGADAPAPAVAPLPPAATPPAVVSTGSACTNCGGGVSTIAAPCGEACADPCAAPARKGLLTRFKEKFSHKKSDCGCEPAPAPAPCTACAPAPAPAPAPCVTCTPAPAPVVKTEICGGCTATADPCEAPKERIGLIARLKSHFKKSDECEPACDTCGTSGTIIHSAAPAAPAAPAPAAAPAPLPAVPAAPAPLPAAPIEPIAPPKEAPAKIGGLPGYPNITPVAAPKVLNGANNPFDLPRRHVELLTHSADYSTLTGSLLFVRADGGYWVVRYASIDAEDRFGGQVVIARDTNMESFQEGDVVQVQGSIIRDKTSTMINSPLYRVSSIALKSRGQ